MECPGELVLQGFERGADVVAQHLEPLARSLLAFCCLRAPHAGYATPEIDGQ